MKRITNNNRNHSVSGLDTAQLSNRSGALSVNTKEQKNSLIINSTFDVNNIGVSDYTFEKEGLAVQGLHPNTMNKAAKSNLQPHHLRTVSLGGSFDKKLSNAPQYFIKDDKFAHDKTLQMGLIGKKTKEI